VEEEELSTPAEKFAEIRTRLEQNPQKLAGLTAVYQFELSGENGGTWHVAIKDGGGTLQEGPAENPGVTILMAADDFVALTDGKLDGTMAFMSGKLKVRGDMGLAMKLQSLVA
jgi:putative sterol carrier protein